MDVSLVPVGGEALQPGWVWLVGAGPGDPDLLTVRGAAALAAADIVFHDALPEGGVLAYARPGARLVPVGKRKGSAPVPQAAIGALLVAAAHDGLRVVRLKGGDPFLFGRGAEEIDALEAGGVPWRVVPGVSAGLAAPAAAGLPITQRGVAGAATFLTGHDESGDLADHDWVALARSGGTLVGFMALSRLDEIAVSLLAAGLPASLPVAVIARATLPGQRVLRTTLGACTLAVRRAALPTPALVVIGAVAARETQAAAAPILSDKKKRGFQGASAP